MKKYISLILLIIAVGFIYYYRETIVINIEKYYNAQKAKPTLQDKNEYYRGYDFNYVQKTSSFSPESKQDIRNIFYTVIDSGQDKFSFFCPMNYKNCLDDVKELANDQESLSHINNFVHPFNSFKHIETRYTTTGKVTINIKKLYTKKQIEEIQNKVDELSQNLINENLSDEENMKSVHDYIINNSKYDSERADNNIINYMSDTAYGPLFEGYALCSGYTDAFELFLEKMHIKSYKVSSNNHIWNAVNLNNKWYNVDLTWDDPVTSDHSNLLEHDYFMINTRTLLSKENTQHDFNQEIYSEIKQEN